MIEVLMVEPEVIAVSGILDDTQGITDSNGFGARESSFSIWDDEGGE